MSALDEGGYGGVQTVNRLFLSAMEERPERVGVVVLLDRGQIAGSIPRWGAGGSKLRFLALALWQWRLAKGSTMVVTHVGLSPVARIVKSLTGAHVIIVLHGAESTRPLRGFRRWGISGAHKLIAVSRHTLDAVAAANPYLRCPAVVCHLPARTLSAGSGSPASRGFGLRVLTVGRLWGRGMKKGQDRLIRLWPSVLQEHPRTELVIVGDGEGRPGLEDLAAQLGVTHAVRFAGTVDDDELARLYEESDVFALPSEGEGFGLVLAEAMQFGLACIASTRDAGAEVIEHGRTGFAVDPHDEADLSDALRRLLGDGQLRMEFGRAGRARVEAHFRPEAFRRRLLEALEA